MKCKKITKIIAVIILLCFSLLAANKIVAQQRNSDDVIIEYETKKKEFDNYLNDNPLIRQAYEFRLTKLSEIHESEHYLNAKKIYSTFFQKISSDIKLVSNESTAFKILHTIAEYEFATNAETAKFYISDNKNEAISEKEATQIAIQTLARQMPELQEELNKSTAQANLSSEILDSMKCLSEYNTKSSLINRFIEKNVPYRLQAMAKDIYFLKMKVAEIKNAGNDKYVDSIINKAKLVIQELKIVKEDLQKEIPDIDNYVLKYRCFPEFSSPVSKEKEVPVKLVGLLRIYDPLGTRKSQEVINGFKYIKEKFSIDQNSCKAVITYESYNLNSDQQKELATLLGNNSIPNETKERIILRNTYKALFDIYYMFSQTYYRPVYEKISELNKCKQELKDLLTYIEDQNKKKEVADFIKEHLDPNIKIFPDDTGTYLTLRNFYKVQLFISCMKKDTQKEAIKKVLQEFQLLRKDFVEGVLSQKNANLDYENFNEFWQGLEKLAITLDQRESPQDDALLKVADEKTKKEAKLFAKLYLECFFVPYLSIDN